MPRGKPNPKLREKFNQLRKEGKTYSEILKILGVSIPKGTLSYWSSKIKLSELSLERLESARKIALVKARGASLEKRLESDKNFLTTSVSIMLIL